MNETQTSSSSPPKLNRDLSLVFLALLFSFEARVIGESSAVSDAFSVVVPTFSGEGCLALGVGFALLRLKITGGVESIGGFLYVVVPITHIIKAVVMTRD